jgi:hypothetical protein
MTTAEPLTINVTPEQRQKFEHLAEENGYDTPDEFALSVLEQFLKEPTKEEILEDMRESFREAFSGQTRPIAEVLAELEAEDDEASS